MRAVIGYVSGSADTVRRSAGVSHFWRSRWQRHCNRSGPRLNATHRRSVAVTSYVIFRSAASPSWPADLAARAHNEVMGMAVMEYRASMAKAPAPIGQAVRPFPSSSSSRSTRGARHRPRPGALRVQPHDLGKRRGGGMSACGASRTARFPTPARSQRGPIFCPADVSRFAAGCYEKRRGLLSLTQCISVSIGAECSVGACQRFREHVGLGEVWARRPLIRRHPWLR
jgi:hypothetical protein